MLVPAVSILQMKKELEETKRVKEKKKIKNILLQHPFGKKGRNRRIFVGMLHHQNHQNLASVYTSCTFFNIFFLANFLLLILGMTFLGEKKES